MNAASKKKKKKKGSKKKSPVESKNIAKLEDFSSKINSDNKKNRLDSNKKVLDQKSKVNRSPFSFFGTAIQFVKEARAELKKVKWPTRKELLATTVMVIVFVLVMATFLGIVDIALQSLVAWIV